MKTRYLLAICLLVFASSCNPFQTKTLDTTVDLKLDQERMLDSGKALNSSTQSVNRYHSVLREIDKAAFSFSPSSKKLEVQLQKNDSSKATFMQIEADFLLPLLPYDHKAQIDDFDKANLLLAEFARNGINLSLQTSNSTYGFVKPESDLFNDKGEYFFINNTIAPNPKVKPLRMSVVNNCLHPGLWEINASDAVGEMYHAWLELPQDFYFNMIRANNHISNPEQELSTFFQQNSLENIPLELGRLRERGELLLKASTQIAKTKELGGYSSQDSRRKIQRKFYEVFKGEDATSIQNFGQLNEEHTFRLHSFLPPGVYDHTESFEVPYRPHWEKVEIYEVNPLTTYGYPANTYQDQGTIEIVLHSKDGKQQMIAGNIPISLLVFAADYAIPAFGAGVLSSSELIERRHLRLREGPLPHYAYMAEIKDGKSFILNNHELGYEQIFLRPIQKGEEMFLRFTVVSYERIVDLMEFEIPIIGSLKTRLLQASEYYQPPLYEIYNDSNIL